MVFSEGSRPISAVSSLSQCSPTIPRMKQLIVTPRSSYINICNGIKQEDLSISAFDRRRSQIKMSLLPPKETEYNHFSPHECTEFKCKWPEHWTCRLARPRKYREALCKAEVMSNRHSGEPMGENKPPQESYNYIFRV